LGEGGLLDMRADIFNIFNHPNFAMPSAPTFSGTSATPLATAGSITSTVTPSRQIQISARIAF
jgi:hypothetical protein